MPLFVSLLPFASSEKGLTRVKNLLIATSAHCTGAFSLVGSVIVLAYALEDTSAPYKHRQSSEYISASSTLR